jgi:carnitine O-acetyltransferase
MFPLTRIRVLFSYPISRDVSFAAVCGKGIDRHLFALKHIAAQEQQNKPIPAIFLDVGYQRLTHNTLSTSTLVAPGLELGGFGPVTDDGYGIGYGINDKGMRFIVTAIEKDHDKGKVESFASVLQQSVLDCFNVISQRYV